MNIISRFFQWFLKTEVKPDPYDEVRWNEEGADQQYVRIKKLIDKQDKRRKNHD